eukprot:g1367.t1
MQIAMLTIAVIMLMATTRALDECQSVTGYVVGDGHDIRQTSADSQSKCCDLCKAEQECASWTFHLDNKICWLHDKSTGAWRQESNVVSGVPSGKLPPRPAPVGSGGDYACSDPDLSEFKFCDRSLSIEQRLDDLVPRINISDMASQLTARQCDAIETIGVPSYYCIVERMGKVLGRELRAYYNAKLHNSLDTWSPTININRDARWGRNVESPGEDPYLAGEYGSAYTKGLQQLKDGTDAVQAVVTLKHWLAYSIENYHGVERYGVDVKVDAYDLASTYMVAWEKVLRDAGALGIMCSYNAVNGLPTCGNPELNRTLREDWQFNGYITSDTDSCQCIIGGHPQGIDQYPARPTNATDAVRQCLMGGTDIDSGNTYANNLAAAISAGEVSLSLVREALRNAYRMRFRMGLFDGDSLSNPYRQIDLSEVGSSQDLSLEAARKSMVLLKNAGVNANGQTGVLPFASKTGTAAVIGQSANDTMAYTGNYDGPLCPEGGAACFAALGPAVAKMNGEGEQTVIITNISDISAAVAAATNADYVILLVDNFRDGGGEGLDRVNVTLSKEQIDLANAIAAVDTPTVLVLVNGGAISIDNLETKFSAILEAWMPGVHGGQAIAETVFGENNPGGKLPVTIFSSEYFDKVDFLNMSMLNGPGRTYRYYDGPDVMWPFGFGLSYSNFSLRAIENAEQPDLGIFRTIGDTNKTVAVRVSNEGSRTGDEVILAFVRPDATSLVASLGREVPVEKRRLIGFKRVTLEPNTSTIVRFPIRPEDVAMADINGDISLHSGDFDIVLSRGHGVDVVFPLKVRTRDQLPVLLKKFRKWW